MWIVILIALVLLTLLFLQIRAASPKQERPDKEEPNRQETASESETQLSNSDFLTECGIPEDSQEAEIALKLRWELAASVTEWIKPFKAENILPDMTCRELMRGWRQQMWYNEGLDSIGFAVIRKIVKHLSLPREAFALLIQPEEKPDITIKELISNYVNVIMQYKPDGETSFETSELTMYAAGKVTLLIGCLEEAIAFAKRILPSAQMDEFETPIAILSKNPSLSELSDTVKSVIGTCVAGQGSFWDLPTKNNSEHKELVCIIEDICNTCHEIQDYYHWPRGY